MGSEDGLKTHFKVFFEKAYLFKRGHVEHILAMANSNLKPFLYYLRPVLVNIHCPEPQEPVRVKLPPQSSFFQIGCAIHISESVMRENHYSFKFT